MVGSVITLLSPMSSIVKVRALFQSLISCFANSRPMPVSSQKCREFGVWYNDYRQQQTGERNHSLVKCLTRIQGFPNHPRRKETFSQKRGTIE